jgi:hypothetical protein
VEDCGNLIKCELCDRSGARDQFRDTELPGKELAKVVAGNLERYLRVREQLTAILVGEQANCDSGTDAEAHRAHRGRRKSRGSWSPTRAKGKGELCDRSGHTMSRCLHYPVSLKAVEDHQGTKLSKRKCERCGYDGHFAPYCPVLRFVREKISGKV